MSFLVDLLWKGFFQHTSGWHKIDVTSLKATGLRKRVLLCAVGLGRLLVHVSFGARRVSTLFLGKRQILSPAI